jgi:NAD-dependent dihydropyrimidine dehydrogenase PreA subunit
MQIHPSTNGLTHPQLQKYADNLLSYLVRQDEADQNGGVRCTTCREYHPWQRVDFGHWQSRQNKSTRYIRENGGPQCKQCNKWGSSKTGVLVQLEEGGEVFHVKLSQSPGEQAAMEVILRKIHGDQKMDLIQDLAKNKARLKKRSSLELQILCSEFLAELECKGHKKPRRK